MAIIGSDAILRELSLFREDTNKRFDDLKEDIGKLSTNLSAIDKAVAVHETRLSDLKDSHTHWYAVAGSVFAIVFSWLLGLWHK